MKKYRQFNNCKGFTLIEVMLALFCIVLTNVLLVGCVQLMSRLSMDSYESEDHIACMQLRFLLAQSEDIVILDDTLQFNYHTTANTLVLHNQRLVKRDGYEIYLKDIDTVSFYEKQGCIYMGWRRNYEQKEALLVCK